MYSITVEATFSAIHSLRLADGRVEPPHGHDWRVRAFFRSAGLDDWGMVVDFDAASARLGEIVQRLHHRDLSTEQPFAGRNPTAEVVARYVFDQLHEVGLRQVWRVEVTEAPGCTAAFETDQGG